MRSCSLSWAKKARMMPEEAAPAPISADAGLDSTPDFTHFVVSVQSPVPARLLTELDDANRCERPAFRRRRQASRFHQLPKQRCALRMRNRRLHADTDEPVRIVDGLPRHAGQRMNRVATANVVS